MPIFHVSINKPSKILDWDLWNEASYFRAVCTTEAYITAQDEKHLAQKMEKLYKGFSYTVKYFTKTLR